MKKLFMAFVLLVGFVSMAFAYEDVVIDEAPLSFVLPDESVSESYRSSIQLYQNGEFMIVLNLITTFGSAEGSFTREGDIFNFEVEYRDFEGFTGDDVTEFQMRRDGDKFIYESDQPIGDLEKGTVMMIVEGTPLAFATFFELRDAAEAEEEDVNDTIIRQKQTPVQQPAALPVYAIERFSRESGTPAGNYVILAPIEAIQKEMIQFINILNPERLRYGAQVQILTKKNNLGLYNKYQIGNMSVVDGVVIN